MVEVAGSTPVCRSSRPLSQGETEDLPVIDGSRCRTHSPAAAVLATEVARDHADAHRSITTNRPLVHSTPAAAPPAAMPRLSRAAAGSDRRRRPRAARRTPQLPWPTVWSGSGPHCSVGGARAGAWCRTDPAPHPRVAHGLARRCPSAPVVRPAAAGEGAVWSVSTDPRPLRVRRRKADRRRSGFAGTARAVVTGVLTVCGGGCSVFRVAAGGRGCGPVVVAGCTGGWLCRWLVVLRGRSGAVVSC